MCPINHSSGIPEDQHIGLSPAEGQSNLLAHEGRTPGRHHSSLPHHLEALQRVVMGSGLPEAWPGALPIEPGAI